MLSNFLTDAAALIIVLGALVFIHELGHFLAAKFFGVRVLTFSLGFGTRLLGYKPTHGFSLGAPTEDPSQTDYRISLLPLGGYVKMAGDDPAQPRDNDPSEFLSHPRWQRFIIAFMGPAMNVALAVALLWVFYRYHFPKPAYFEQPVRVAEVDAGSPAANAGVRPGDLLVRFGKVENPTWEDLLGKENPGSASSIPVVVSRDGREQTFDVSLTSKTGDRVAAGWRPAVPPVVGEVDPDLPAARAGLQPGDKITAVDGQPITDSSAIISALQAASGKQVDFTVERKHSTHHYTIIPVYAELQGERKWRIGVAFDTDVVYRQIPWGQALSAAVDTNVRGSMAVLDLLGKLVTRRASVKNLGGPIAIAQSSGAALRDGMASLVSWTSFISLQLAIFNLLPVPILDGGMILMLLVEGLMRRDLSLSIKQRILQAGMVFLLLLAVFVMCNDIVRTFRAS